MLCNFLLLLPSILELVQLFSAYLLFILLVGVSHLFRFRKNFAYYNTYRLIDLKSFLLSIKEIVRVYLFYLLIYINVKVASFILCF